MRLWSLTSASATDQTARRRRARLERAICRPSTVTKTEGETACGKKAVLKVMPHTSHAVST